MEFIGVLAGLILVFCIVISIFTSHYRWLVTIIWCIPLIGIGVNYTPEMELNGFLVLLCTINIIFCICSVYGIRLWNNKKWKKSRVIYPIIFLFTFLTGVYCYDQAQNIGYIYDFYWLREKNIYLYYIVYYAVFLLISKTMATTVYMVIDRFFSRKKELKLIMCKFYISGLQNTLGIIDAYYLSGINNGVTYHFKLTKRNFKMLRREKRLILQTKEGCFGGIYVCKNPCPQNIKYVKKFDKRVLILSIILYILLVCALFYILEIFKF